MISAARQWRAACVLVYTVFVCIAAWVSHDIAKQQLIDQSQRAAFVSLNIHASHIDRVIDKYRMLTPFILQDTVFSDYLSLYLEEDLDTSVSDVLARSTAMSGAREIRLMRPDGTIVATSGTARVLPAITYPTQHLEMARNGRLGRTIVKMNNGQQHYMFAYAMKHNGQVQGLIDLRFSLDDVQQNWALYLQPLLAITDAGDVVLTNQPDLENTVLDFVPETSLFSTRQSRFVALTPESGQVKDTKTGKIWIPISLDMPVLGWTLLLLIDLSPISRQAQVISVAITLGLIVLGGLVWTLSDRSLRNRFERMKDQITAQKLEQTVEMRTEALRQAQADLVQAAKLAGLGQMSAAISHEFNQPLGAIRMFADNAEQLMNADKSTEATQALSRIRGLVDRMAELSKTLKTFARKPGLETKAVDVADVVHEALIVLTPRLKKDPVEIQILTKDTPLLVKAGPIRLEQVILNILSNALDALQRTSRPIIQVHWTHIDHLAYIVIQDNGPGIDPDILDKQFDPFITSKGPGEGLGLGLSIAYNIMRDFEGDLRGENHADGGAQFTLSLPLFKESASVIEAREEPPLCQPPTP